MEGPIVSVCIPTFNGGDFLKDALESIKVQGIMNIEVIISDDASTDSTLEIVEVFKNEASFPVHVFHHNPKGIGANWNNCVKNANGEFIKFLLQDDVLEPDCLEKMMAYAQLEKEIGLVYCKRKFIVEENLEGSENWIELFGILHCSWSNLSEKSGPIPGKVLLRDKNLLSHPKNKIGEPTAVLLKKNCFKKVGYFREDLKQNLDIEYWWRVMKYFKVCFIDEELVSFRLHKSQATQAYLLKGAVDSSLLNSIIYKELWLYLHPSLKWKLFWSENKILNAIRKLKKYSREK